MNVSSIMRRVLVLVAATVFTGCHADVAAFRVSVRDAGQDYSLSLRDETRRPYEEEAVVSEALEEDPRFRIEELPEEIGNNEIVMLELELSGDYRGGTVAITGPVDYSASFSQAVDLVSLHRSEGNSPEADAADVGTVLLRLALGDQRPPVRAAELRGVELIFTAETDRDYTIEAVRFLAQRPPLQVTLSGSTDPSVFDDRLPMVGEAGEWHFPDLSYVLGEISDGVDLRYRMAPNQFDDRTNRPRITLEIHGSGDERQSLQLYLRPGTQNVIVRPALWHGETASLTVRDAPEGFELLQIAATSVSADPSAPIPVEMSELLRFPADQWRREDFELFTWTLYPNILWFDTRDYQVQARFFRRLAFFVEKRGFIGRLLTDAELQERHGWNAHNYRPEGLADFFNAVRTTDFPINEYESQLREIVLARGIIVEDDDGRFLPGRGGILSVSQESFLELRRLLIVHEAMHGVFYEESDFRRAAFNYWDDVLDTRERGFWRDFFSWMTYSPDDRYLMVNEFQAYLLQQSERNVRWYFRSRTADRLKNAYPQRVEQLDIFLRDYPTTFVDAGGAMNQALFEAAGMVGGDPFCLQLMSDQ